MFAPVAPADHPSRRFLRQDQGAVLVEFALAAPLLAILMCAIIDFSMAMFTLNNLTTAVREGARMAAVRKWTAASKDADVAAVKQRVRDQITLSFASAGGSDGTIAVSEPDATTGDITVTLTDYTYVPVTPVAPAFGMDNIEMGRQAVFRWERFQPSAP